VVGSYEYGNEHSRSIKDEKILTVYQLLKERSALYH
jgi:hypothetical protein